MAELAQAMVASLGGGLMGVDVLVAQDGRLLALEANAPFGFDVTDPDQGRWVARAALAAAGVPV
jgi:glutathione synthase/RimK-type ligase-like ATP-grasp enzyme